MSARRKNAKHMPIPVLPQTIVSVAAEQIADAAIELAMDGVNQALADSGFAFGDDDGPEQLPGWDALQEEIAALIIGYWTKRAAEVEQAMRAAGVEPKVEFDATVPKGVVPS